MNHRHGPRPAVRHNYAIADLKQAPRAQADGDRADYLPAGPVNHVDGRVEIYEAIARDVDTIERRIAADRALARTRDVEHRDQGIARAVDPRGPAVSASPDCVVSGVPGDGAGIVLQFHPRQHRIGLAVY